MIYLGRGLSPLNENKCSEKSIVNVCELIGDSYMLDGE